MSRTKKVITPFRRSKAPVQATRKAKPATIHPATLPGRAGTSLFRNAPAAVATAPIERAPAKSCTTSTIQTAQWRGPGTRSKRSIIPSPVQAV